MTRKEKVLKYMQEVSKIPLKVSELAVILDVPSWAHGELLNILEELTAEGELIKTKRGKYTFSKSADLYKGVFLANQKGFAFVETDDDLGDIFISASDRASALHGDTVMVKLLKNTKGPRREGVVVSVVKRSETPIVGEFKKGKKSGFVLPDNKRILSDIYIAEACINSAKDGDIVSASLLNKTDTGKNPEGEITEILGRKGEIGIDILAVAKECGIKTEFPANVCAAAKRCAKAVTPDMKADRLDLTNEQIITIDGEDAKDLDDAVSLKINESGNFLLGVHIADVGHYVKLNTVMDREAFERGTSVYLTDRVIPMLPKELSNGICSLNPHEERLALSVYMEIDKAGKVLDYKITESVIKSCERMTYSDVTKILEGDKKLDKRYKHIKDMLFLMRELKDILHKMRKKRGSIDFDFPESRVVLDDNGRAADVLLREISESNHIIEEFMLVCNETVAEHMFWLGVPFVYRIHEEPSDDKITEFIDSLSCFGYSIKRTKNKIYPKEFQKLLNEIKGKKEELVISTIMLRSLMKAKYSDENTGHFGLAAKYYCHFTSPIRRYPDLVIHRIIKDSLKGKKPKDGFLEFVKSAAEKSSCAELAAMEAEHICEDMKKAEYMENFIGEHFSGIISSVTSFGFFVELPNTVEGLVSLSSLRGDYYEFDEKSRILTGKRSGKTYKIGDEVEIIVANANKKARRVDFEIVQKSKKEI